MREIQLTQGKVALVDDDDYEELSRFKWCARKSRNVFYAIRSERVDGKFLSVLMHRQILNINTTSVQVDHDDYNGLNNQRHNLVVVSNRGNQLNRRDPNKKSLLPGAYWHKFSKKWTSGIRLPGGKRKWLGTFNSDLEAHIAYVSALKSYGLLQEVKRVNTLTGLSI